MGIVIIAMAAVMIMFLFIVIAMIIVVTITQLTLVGIIIIIVIIMTKLTVGSMNTMGMFFDFLVFDISSMMGVSTCQISAGTRIVGLSRRIINAASYQSDYGNDEKREIIETHDTNPYKVITRMCRILTSNTTLMYQAGQTH
jgi:hypothetical protein